MHYVTTSVCKIEIDALIEALDRLLTPKLIPLGQEIKGKKGAKFYSYRKRGKPQGGNPHFLRDYFFGSFLAHLRQIDTVLDLL